MQLLEGERIPEELKNLMSENKKIFLVAGTLRPETMYGQINCYIHPKGIYGLYEMKNKEFYITSKHAILNMAYQDKTKEFKKCQPLLEIKGQNFIGEKISAPLIVLKEVYLFPMKSLYNGQRYWNSKVCSL